MYKLRKGPFIYEKLYKGKNPTIQNNGRIFKECSNKGAILGYIGRVTCIIEQKHKKKLSVINWISEGEKAQETEEKQNTKSQQCSVKHEMVRQSMHECCSEAKLWYVFCQWNSLNTFYFQ